MVKVAKRKSTSKEVNWLAVGDAWASLEAQLGPISFAQTSANFVCMQRYMDQLLEITAGPEVPPALFNLLDCVSDWVEAYEAVHVPIDSPDPVEVLKHLMEANGLRQKDLADELDVHHN